MSRADDRNQRQQQDRQRQLSSREPSQTRDAVDPNAYRLGPRDPLRGTVKATSADGGSRQANTTYNSSQPTGKVLKSQAGAGKLTLDGPNVRKRPAVLIEEEAPVEKYSVKWLLTSVNASNQLIVRVGGQKASPDIIATFQLNANTYYEEQVRLTAPLSSTVGDKVYFSFALTNSGPKESDWVVSYGTREVLSSGSLDGDQNVSVEAVQRIKLYRITPANGEELVYQDDLTYRTLRDTSSYFYSSYDVQHYWIPAGYGNWQHVEYRIDREPGAQVITEYQSFIFNDLDSLVSAVASETSGLSGTAVNAYAATTIGAPAEWGTSGPNYTLVLPDLGSGTVTRENTGTKATTGNTYGLVWSGFSNGQISKSGNTAYTVHTQWATPIDVNFKDQERTSVFVRRGNNPNDDADTVIGSPLYPTPRQSGIRTYWDYDFGSPFANIDWLSTTPNLTDDYCYSLEKENGQTVVLSGVPAFVDYRITYSNAEILFSGQRALYVNRWNVRTGNKHPRWKKVTYYGFELPETEYDDYAYSAFNMQIQFYQ